jgi:hypothetical protein
MGNGRQLDLAGIITPSSTEQQRSINMSEKRKTLYDGKYDYCELVNSSGTCDNCGDSMSVKVKLKDFKTLQVVFVCQECARKFWRINTGTRY